jgi:hypothetical protein
MKTLLHIINQNFACMKMSNPALRQDRCVSLVCYDFPLLRLISSAVTLEKKQGFVLSHQTFGLSISNFRASER